MSAEPLSSRIDCSTACRISLGGEGNALYPVLSSFSIRYLLFAVVHRSSFKNSNDACLHSHDEELITKKIELNNTVYSLLLVYEELL